MQDGYPLRAQGTLALTSWKCKDRLLCARVGWPCNERLQAPFRLDCNRLGFLEKVFEIRCLK